MMQFVKQAPWKTHVHLSDTLMVVAKPGQHGFNCKKGEIYGARQALLLYKYKYENL